MAENPRWTKIEEISPTESGHYVFAEDLINRPLEYQPLPNGERPSDNIVGRGERPCWERDILDYFLKRHPQTVIIPDIPSSVRDINRSTLNRISLPLSPYLYGTGLCFSDDEYYWIYRGNRGDPSRMEAKLFIEDVGMPQRLPDGHWNKRALPLRRNGVLEMSLRGYSRVEVDERGPYWRGELILRACCGTGSELKLGVFAEEAVTFLNGQVAGGIPLWGDNHFVDPILHPRQLPIR